MHPRMPKSGEEVGTNFYIMKHSLASLSKTAMTALMLPMLFFGVIGCEKATHWSEPSNTGISMVALDRSSLLDLVPSADKEAFLNSLTYEEGLFRGAEVAYIEPYLTTEQVDEVITGYIGTASAGVEIFPGYKPKPRGCKANNRWICVIHTLD